MQQKDRHNHLIFNGIVWCLSFVILLFAFAENRSQIAKIDYIYTLCFLLTLVPPILLNLYVLMPRLLAKGKYIFFVLVFVANLLFFTKINDWFFSSLVDKILPDYFFISYHSETSLLFIFSVFLVVTMLLKLAEEGFYLQKRESAILRMQNEKAQLELASIRAQLHPHFLFNALNVIYGLAMEKSQKTTDAVVQLSDILRYVVYDANTEKVPLEKEVALLKNYVAFQKNRTFVEDIRFDAKIDEQSYMICPMLLLPLLENAFKHGAKTAKDFVYMGITVADGTLQVVICNSFEEKENGEKSGVGLEMVTRNLALFYPQRHSFTVAQKNGIFDVNLKIEL